MLTLVISSMLATTMAAVAMIVNLVMVRPARDGALPAEVVVFWVLVESGENVCLFVWHGNTHTNTQTRQTDEGCARFPESNGEEKHTGRALLGLGD